MLIESYQITKAPQVTTRPRTNFPTIKVASNQVFGLPETTRFKSVEPPRAQFRVEPAQPIIKLPERKPLRPKVEFNVDRSFLKPKVLKQRSREKAHDYRSLNVEGTVKAEGQKRIEVPAPFKKAFDEKQVTRPVLLNKQKSPAEAAVEKTAVRIQKTETAESESKQADLKPKPEAVALPKPIISEAQQKQIETVKVVLEEAGFEAKSANQLVKNAVEAHQVRLGLVKERSVVGREAGSVKEVDQKTPPKALEVAFVIDQLVLDERQKELERVLEKLFGLKDKGYVVTGKDLAANLRAEDELLRSRHPVLFQDKDRPDGSYSGLVKSIAQEDKELKTLADAKDYTSRKNKQLPPVTIALIRDQKLEKASDEQERTVRNGQKDQVKRVSSFEQFKQRLAGVLTNFSEPFIERISG